MKNNHQLNGIAPHHGLFLQPRYVSQAMQELKIDGMPYSLELTVADKSWGRCIRIVVKGVNQLEVGRVQYCVHPEFSNNEYWQSQSNEHLFNEAANRFSEWVRREDNFTSLSPGCDRFFRFNSGET